MALSFRLVYRLFHLANMELAPDVIVGHYGDLDDLHSFFKGWNWYFVRAWRLLEDETFLAES